VTGRPAGAGEGRRAFSPSRGARAAWLLGLLLLPVPGGAGSLCLYLETAGRIVATIPAAPASELRLSFRHSLYGTTVEEIFDVRGDGLQTVRLVYAEPRLAEFYGREGARYEDGSWVATPERRTFAALHLRVSPDSSMQLYLDSRPVPLRELVEPGAAVRVAATSCAGGNDGR
jgi:hypothetical protein